MRIGVDLGGTKVEAIVLGADGRERQRRRVRTPSHSAHAIVATIKGVVEELESELGVTATVGVGTPGAVSPASGLLKNSNTECLNGVPLVRMLCEACEREVRVANDANCFALSEAVDGAAAGKRVVFGVIIGTGTGGAVVVDKRVLVGPNAVAGEWGHNPLPWPDEHDEPAPCYCGKRGCIETYLCGAGLLREHRRRAAQPDDARTIAEAAHAGDDAAAASVERYQERLAKALASVVNLIDPDVVVLGGGLSNIEALYRGLNARIERYAFSDRVSTPVVRARHGDSSGVRGAAWLWPPADSGQGGPP
jgi:fructokinase